MWSEAFEVVFSGLAMVFLVLGVIFLMMVLLRLLFAQIEKKRTGKVEVAPVGLPGGNNAAEEEELAAVALALSQVLEEDPAAIKIRKR